MESEKRKALEEAGWQFGDAADFLGMSEPERQLLDARVEMALAVRRLRESLNLSQKQLAVRIKTSQPRIVKIERAAADVSLDQILRAFTAAGGRIVVKQIGQSRTTKAVREKAAAGRKKTEATKKPQTAEVQINLSRAECAP